MKKLICVLMSILMCMSVCACNILTVEDETVTPNAQPIETDAETESESESETYLELTTKIETETESKTYVNTEVETETESETESYVETETENHTETESETYVNTEIETETESETEASTQKADKIDHLEFAEFMVQAGFGEYLPKDDFFALMGKYTYEGKSITDDRVLHSSGMYSEGYMIYLIKSGIISNKYETTSDGSYEMYKNTLKIGIDLEGLTLPYEITFEDTINTVFAKMGYENTPYDCFEADKSSKFAMTLYKKNGELLIYRDFQRGNPEGELIIPYVLEYTKTDRYILGDEGVGTLTYSITLSFSSDLKLYRVEISVCDEHGIKAEDPLPTNMPVFGRVECKNKSGILVDLVGIGEVYIEGSYNFKMFDSVAVTYDPDDLIEESGKIPCLCIIDMPSESIYEYILIDLIEIRKTDPSKGEPLYD